MGLTAALAGSAILLAGSRLEHLAPSWPLILADYGVTIVLHLGLAFAAVCLVLRLSATPLPFDTRLARAVPDLADP